ncbi:hypothetical protein AVL50_02830 [Flammeovirga sp. SJP92]|nr:hypothetical protein AVL50_02830 [Flammeovirga sp. SJP92]
MYLSKSNNIMKSLIKVSYIFLASVVVGCTDLKEEILDETLNKDLITSNEAAESVTAAAYARLRSTFTNHAKVFGLQEITTDEAMCPTRGTDWDDNGLYRELHTHTWTANNGAIRNTWNELNQGVAKSMIAIKTMQDMEGNFDRYIAETTVLKAFYMMHLLDLYGQVPTRDVEILKFNDSPMVLKGEEAVQYIAEDLLSTLDHLGSKEEIGNSRITKEAAQALLSRLYLNSAVYINPYASSYKFKSEDLTKVIQYASEVINSSSYQLETADYFSIFDTDNHGHSEMIFAVDQRLEYNLGDNLFSVVSLARSQKPTPTRRGWNGFSTLPEFVDTWDITDPRYSKVNFVQEEGTLAPELYELNRGFLSGQQFGPVLNEDQSDFVKDASGQLIITALMNDRDGQPTNFTKEVKLFDNQSSGIRVAKYQFDHNGSSNGRGQVDIPLVRLGDVYLMRAEAKFRNNDVSGALSDINTLRTARGAKPLTSLTEEALFNERGFELYWEMQRRTDMIRFGKFEDKWTEKSSSDPNKRVFPLPQTALDANLNLVQNQGY